MANVRLTMVVLAVATRLACAQTPPTRPADGPGAPHWIVVGASAPGMSAPADQNGDFLIGPNYQPAPELSVLPGTPAGTVRQFTLESKDSRSYAGIARNEFGTVDPANPRALIVQTHPRAWQRAITVYENNAFEMKDGKFWLNGQIVTQYTFKMNYFWMMGDNRHGSQDSRYWGFVPEDHVVGEAALIWMSWDHGVRWSRLFKKIR